MASVQRRTGPTVVGFWGFLQPFADALKLVVKEIIIPSRANKFLFVFSPALTLFLSFLGWVSIPFDFYTEILDLNVSLLYILVISSFGVYGILLSGWSSNCATWFRILLFLLLKDSLLFYLKITTLFFTKNFQYILMI